MDIRNKDEFIIFMQRATEDTSNDCYIELYNILLRWLMLLLNASVSSIYLSFVRQILFFL